MDLTYKEKLPIRVPRASNLNSLKILFKSINDYKSMDETYRSSIFESESHYREYWQLLIYLDWIVKIDNRFILTNTGLEIQRSFSDDPFLNDQDINILRSEILKLYFVKMFLKNVFEYDLSVSLPNNAVSLNKLQIEEKYCNYRKVSGSVASRESRVIYNWLLGINIIESITVYKKNDKPRSEYHLTINRINLNDFATVLKNVYENSINKVRPFNEWIELPILRYGVCVTHFISRRIFDDHLLKLYFKNDSNISLSTASAIRKEVENEGLFVNNKVYFYLKYKE